MTFGNVILIDRREALQATMGFVQVGQTKKQWTFFFIIAAGQTFFKYPNFDNAKLWWQVYGRPIVTKNDILRLSRNLKSGLWVTKNKN